MLAGTPVYLFFIQLRVAKFYLILQNKKIKIKKKDFVFVLIYSVELCNRVADIIQVINIGYYIPRLYIFCLNKDFFLCYIVIYVYMLCSDLQSD